MSMQHKFDLKSQVCFQTQIAQHHVQLPLHYIQFEIAKFSCLNKGLCCWYKYFIDPLLSWAQLYKGQTTLYNRYITI